MLLPFLSNRKFLCSYNEETRRSQKRRTKKMWDTLEELLDQIKDALEEGESLEFEYKNHDGMIGGTATIYHADGTKEEVDLFKF